MSVIHSLDGPATAMTGNDATVQPLEFAERPARINLSTWPEKRPSNLSSCFGSSSDLPRKTQKSDRSASICAPRISGGKKRLATSGTMSGTLPWRPVLSALAVWLGT